MFCEGDSIVLKMFASFINPKLSVTVQFDEGLACEYNAISHTDKAGRINQWYDHLLSSSSWGNEGNILLCTITTKQITNRKSDNVIVCAELSHTLETLTMSIRQKCLRNSDSCILCEICAEVRNCFLLGGGKKQGSEEMG